MILDDETLMAYADGESEHAAEIEASLATRPTLAARVKEMRALRKTVSDAFAPIAAQRPPVYLTALLAAPRAVAPVAKRAPVYGFALAAAAVALIAVLVTNRSDAPAPQMMANQNDRPMFIPPVITLTPRGAVIAPSILPPDSAPLRSHEIIPVYADAVWVLRPDAQMIEGYYPARAAAQNIQGRVVLNCRINAEGSVDCVVASEGPPGWGFGDAALALASSFLMAEKAANGMRTTDGQITIPIIFAPRNCMASPSAIALRAPASSLEPASAPAPTAPRVIHKPIWIQTPSAQNMARIYALHASRAMDWGKRGHVVVRCIVALDGALTNCAIASETPTGWGFGNAALKVAQQFRMAPQTANGEPTAGGVVDVPIAFRRGS